MLRKFADVGECNAETLEEVGRFNEAIDQAITESVKFFTVETERWRNVFLGILGHDLRGPLTAILQSAEIVSRITNEERVLKSIGHVLRGGKRMESLLDDLLDYSRTSFEQGIPVQPSDADISAVVGEGLASVATALPKCDLRYAGPDNFTGRIDASRFR